MTRLAGKSLLLDWENPARDMRENQDYPTIFHLSAQHSPAIAPAALGIIRPGGCAFFQTSVPRLCSLARPLRVAAEGTDRREASCDLCRTDN